MPDKFHLGKVQGPCGTIWFSLVLEGPDSHVVLRYNDTPHPLVKDRVLIIRPPEYDNYEINGVPLSRLVAERMTALKAVIEKMRHRPAGEQRLNC